MAQWQTKSTQQGSGLTPEWSGRWVSLRAPSLNVAVPTDADAGRTDVSVDPVRRTARTPSGRPLSVTPTATATSSDCAPADPPAAPMTTASATKPMPADGPGSRSRLGESTHLSCDLRRHSSCCLRRRPRRQPTYPGSRSRPAGRRSTLRSPGNTVDDPDVAQGTAVPS